MSSLARFKEGDRVRFHNGSSEPSCHDDQEGVIVNVTLHGQLGYGYGVRLLNGITLGAAEYELELIQLEEPRPV